MARQVKIRRRFEGAFSVKNLIGAFWGRIAATWAIVALENTMIALIPFLIGLTIDGLMAGRYDELITMVIVLIVLGAVAVARRIYDTRAYGAIRVHLGAGVDRAHEDLDVSTRSTRLDLSRELVDFLEHEAPELLTAVIQIIVSLVVLWLFDWRLGASSITVVILMVMIYAAFHRRFFQLNARLNAAKERQVAVLELGRRLPIFEHLRRMQKAEVSLSDTEGIVYGGIFLAQIGYIAINLVLAAGLPELTAGRIFSIATYSWEYVEAALALPMALQSWSRLSEITARLNRTEG